MKDKKHMTESMITGNVAADRLSDEPTPITDVSIEYAIYLPSKGWIQQDVRGFPRLHTDPDFHGVTDLDDARAQLGRIRDFYHQMGADVIGQQLVLVSRTTRVSRTNWDVMS